MRKKVKWVNTDEVVGYIEYKDNGDIIVCYGSKENLQDYIMLELEKQGEKYEIKKSRLD